MHDNIDVPFTDRSELLLFTILKIFSGILNVLVLLGFGVRFGCLVWFGFFV